MIRVPGLLFHAASVVIIAYGITIKKPIRFYLIAVFFHFANNFFALLGNIWYIVGPILLFLTFIIAYLLYKQSTDVIVDNI